MKLRLFFGIPLPHRQAETIAAWRDSLALDGRPVPARNLHMTLAFLGQQPEDRLDELKRIAGRIKSEGFELTLDQVATSRRGLLSLSPAHPPGALLSLAAQLAEGLLAAGYTLDDRDFWPHVTLARHCPARHGLLPPDCTCRIDRFVLFQSLNEDRGTFYEPLSQWQLP